MAEYFLNSDDIYVFPCANRGVPDAGKFTTEFNLRMLAKAAAAEKVVQSTNASCAECFVNGYYVALDLATLISNNADLKGKQVYLLLNIVKPPVTGSPVKTMKFYSSIEHQQRLMPFGGEADTSVLDVGSQFKGAKIIAASGTSGVNGAVKLGSIGTDGTITWVVT